MQIWKRLELLNPNFAKFYLWRSLSLTSVLYYVKIIQDNTVYKQTEINI